MLIRIRAAIGVSLALIAGVAPSAALAAPPILTDGSVKCQGNRCVAVAKAPGQPRQPVSHPSAPQRGSGPASGGGGRPAAPLTETNVAMGNHIETYCQSAAAGNGGTMPPECQPPAPAPNAAAPVPPSFTPADATRMALDKLVVPRAQIHTPLCEGCSTLVGIPVWFWSQPWQEQTATATAGPYTVTAVARPVSITWTPGDGSPNLVCTNAGEPYDLSFGIRDSSCSARYQHRGDWTLTATWTWQVTWSGAANGSSIINTASTAPISIRESQAIIQSNS